MAKRDQSADGAAHLLGGHLYGQAREGGLAEEPQRAEMVPVGMGHQRPFGTAAPPTTVTARPMVATGRSAATGSTPIPPTPTSINRAPGPPIDDNRMERPFPTWKTRDSTPRSSGAGSTRRNPSSL